MPESKNIDYLSWDKDNHEAYLKKLQAMTDKLMAYDIIKQSDYRLGILKEPTIFIKDTDKFKCYAYGCPVIEDPTRIYTLRFVEEKSKWYNRIVLPYISIGYDRYWHQIVVGYGKYRLGVGCVLWKRLFGIGKAWNKGLEERNGL